MGTNDKYRIFLIFLDFIFIDLLEWMVFKMSGKLSKLVLLIQKKFNFASTFCVVLLEKRPVKILASFLVDSIAGEHLAPPKQDL